MLNAETTIILRYSLQSIIIQCTIYDNVKIMVNNKNTGMYTLV